jgi:hypothetical protein
MAKTLEDMATVYSHVCQTMNNRINQIGQIPTSDLTIKTWHNYTNDDWDYVLDAVLEIDKVYDVPPSLVRDVKVLKQHLTQYSSLCDNILYPSLQEEKSLRLPKSATTIFHNGQTKTVKTVTFRAMMQSRELYCDICDLVLPNEDSSKGKLDAKPIDSLFDF